MVSLDKRRSSLSSLIDGILLPMGRSPIAILSIIESTTCMYFGIREASFIFMFRVFDIGYSKTKFIGEGSTF